MAYKKVIDRSLLATLVIGCLVLVNVIGVKVFGRADLTADKQYTLSRATKSVLSSLKDPLTVRAYFTADLPAEQSSNARYVKDLLDEYYNAASGNFRYEFIDPAASETDADKEKKKDIKHDIFGRAVREATSVEQELQSLGIPPVQVRVNEADKIEVKRAYMGLALFYGDKKEVIPVVKDTTELEYDLTLLIRKLSREKTPKIALIGGHDGYTAQGGIGRAWQLLGQNYELVTVDLTQHKEIPADVDAALVAGPMTPFGDEEKRALDAFIMSGKSAAFLLDTIRPELQTLESRAAEHGLGDLLASYGVDILPGLVLDAECAMINVAQQRGFMRIMQPVSYPFIATPRALDAEHPLTRGIGNVSFPFMSALAATADPGEGVKVASIVRSSPRSWIQEAPFNLDPMQRWTADMVKEEGIKNLVMSASGPLKSYANEGLMATNARVLVAGGATFMTDQFLSPGNEALLLNLVDWLVLDEALLEVRTRGLGAAPLAELGEGARKAVKLINIAGLPFAFVVLGVVRWRLRERRRSQVHS